MTVFSSTVTCTDTAWEVDGAFNLYLLICSTIWLVGDRDQTIQGAVMTYMPELWSVPVKYYQI